MPSGQPGLFATFSYSRIFGKPLFLGRIDSQFPMQYKPETCGGTGSKSTHFLYESL